MDPKDYYNILGISKNATQQEIKTAYRKLSKKYHPDVNGGDKNLEMLFIEIQEAYEILSDEYHRSRYDADISDPYNSVTKEQLEAYRKRKQQAYNKRQEYLKKRKAEQDRRNRAGYILVWSVVLFVVIMCRYSIRQTYIRKEHDEAMLQQITSLNDSQQVNEKNENIDLLNRLKWNNILTGGWEGTLYFNNNYQKRDITLYCDPLTGIYAADYPSQGCSGSWSIINFTEKSITFSEYIETGKAGCEATSEILIQQLNPDEILCAFYTVDKEEPVATAVLSRKK